ncbi:MAG: hypothetical protein WD035_05385 [Balneolaceae bacterium]
MADSEWKQIEPDKEIFPLSAGSLLLTMRAAKRQLSISPPTQYDNLQF